jgi:hypothetical protein
MSGYVEGVGGNREVPQTRSSAEPRRTWKKKGARGGNMVSLHAAEPEAR